jgi:hypothetical protein
MTFQVSVGRSASLKLQSNFSPATGSSVGSWYGETYSCASDSDAVMRLTGSNTSIFSSRSSAGDALNGWKRRERQVRTRLVVTAQLLAERHALALGQALYEAKSLWDTVRETSTSNRGNTHVLAADGLDDVVRRCSEELRDDGKLVNVCKTD